MCRVTTALSSVQLRQLGHLGIPLEIILILLTEIFQTPSLGLWQEQSWKHPSEHEQSENFQNVGEEFPFTANIDQSGETDLSDDGSEFTARCADSVGGRSVSGGEDFAGDDEGSGVWSEVLEKVGHAVLNGKWSAVIFRCM
jgi:hypothetical protein